MANPVLFKSAFTLGMIHFVALWISGTLVSLLAFYYAWGIFTSLWNHGTTSRVAMWVDRITMVVAVVLDFAILYFLPSPWRMYLLAAEASGVVSYLSAKFEIAKGGGSGNPYHVCCHMFATFAHVMILLQLKHSLPPVVIDPIPLPELNVTVPELGPFGLLDLASNFSGIYNATHLTAMYST
eukprot:CAMPEP_0177677920 /NCGR_PEP_ID=MMETSP0447-20121125/28700_1 /TAXON_ID=0 /ORGANISM="Stygamoeba regulata, Strain BSH-02190019" /LENGTH=181 /DNA_ID=CAMNT_0019186823 /DNA_START=11 /DNA_END=556 /DNA_ORIENTATION=-